MSKLSTTPQIVPWFLMHQSGDGRLACGAFRGAVTDEAELCQNRYYSPLAERTGDMEGWKDGRAEGLEDMRVDRSRRAGELAGGRKQKEKQHCNSHRRAAWALLL